MTTPCENKDDIKSLHTKVDNLTESFNAFRLGASIDIANLKNESKKSGGIWGAVASIIIAIASIISAKAGL